MASQTTQVQMIQFQKAPHGFELRVPQTDSEGHITTEAAVPRSAIAAIYADGTDTERCIDCGQPSCSTGVQNEAKVLIKCPFEHDIPDIQEEMEYAHFHLKTGFKILQKVAPDAAAKIAAQQANLDNPDIARVRARAPMSVFDALRKAELPHKAQELETKYNKHMKKAFALSEGKGPMHDVYGRICSDSLCKSSCNPGLTGHGSVEIPMNMTQLGDYAFESGWLTPIVPAEKQDQTILIVGSGFAALAATDKALHMGYDVVVVDKNKAISEPGNKNILNYKVLQERFNHHVDRYKASGAEFVTGVNVGEKGALPDELAEKYNAVAIIYATGTPKAKTLSLKGDAANDCIAWDALLHPQQEFDNPHVEGVDPAEKMAGKTLAVIGTSDTAVDVLHTAALKGAKDVILISRGNHFSATDLPALKKAKKTAEELGVTFTVQNYMKPHSVSYNEAGQKILSGTDAQKNDGSDIALTVDEVVFAVSNETGDLKAVFGDKTLPTKPWGTFAPVGGGEGHGYLGMTKNGVFQLSAGDNTRGGSLAAKAGSDGIKAVELLDRELKRTDGQKPFADLKIAPGL